MNPGDSVGVLNPKHDGRGTWLKGMVLQRVGRANCLFDVSGQPRYFHIKHLRFRNRESVPIGGDSTGIKIATISAPEVPVREIPEEAGEELTSTNTPGERQSSIKGTTTPLVVPTQATDSDYSDRSTASATESKQGSEERRYSRRLNRQRPVGFRDI